VVLLGSKMERDTSPMTYNVIVNMPIVVTVKAHGEEEAKRKAMDYSKAMYHTGMKLLNATYIKWELATTADVIRDSESKPRRTICGGCGEQPKACRNLPECQEERAERRKR
jgi:hypothetical protein